jgi:hypothetical protein
LDVLYLVYQMLDLGLEAELTKSKA